MADGRLFLFGQAEKRGIMSLQTIMAASSVGIGVFVALNAERRVAKLNPAVTLTNIWAADGYFASLEARKDGALYRLRAWLDQAGLCRLHVLEFLGPDASAAGSFRSLNAELESTPSLGLDSNEGAPHA